MSLRDAAKALLNDYDSIEPGDGVVMVRWPEMEALREALAEAPKAEAEKAEAVVKQDLTTEPVAPSTYGTFFDQIVEAKRDYSEWPQWMKDSAHISAAVAHPPAALPESFAEWVRKNMPAGTVISDPEWWIPRLQRAAARGLG